MTILTNAQEFLQSHGRDIDQARYNFHFGNLSKEELLAVLARYQNPDGGFFGLEVDIAAPQSNPFAVELALLICLQAGMPPNHPLLQKTLTYLETTQDSDGGWQFVPEIYQHPLAPWFQGWIWPNLNPACTIAGLLLELELDLEAPKMLASVAQLFARLENPEEVIQGEFYTVRPYAYYFLAETNHPHQSFYRAEITQWLIRQHDQEKLDNTHFFEYIRSQHSYAGKSIPSHILQTRLEMLEAEQAEDGGWPTPYDPHWRPWITVNNLLVLKAFERL